MKIARVFTKPKKNTLDPQGIVVNDSLKKMGIKHIENVNIGRYIELLLEDGISQDEIEKNVITAVEKLLHNNIIEDFEIIYDEVSQ